MRLSIRLLGLTAAAGLALVLIGLIVGRPTVVVEGAYFGSPGSRGSGGVFLQAAPGLLDPSDGNLWAGGGVALLVLSVLGVLTTRSRWSLRAPSAPQPDEPPATDA